MAMPQKPQNGFQKIDFRLAVNMLAGVAYTLAVFTFHGAQYETMGRTKNQE